MKLAIRGHEIRGAEVIALLEMLGGINDGNLYGDLEDAYYFIGNLNEIDTSSLSEDVNSKEYLLKQYLLYSLEEFEKRFPFKIGDKVLINGNTSSVRIVKSMKWDNERVTYRLEDLDGIESVKSWYANEMMPYTDRKKEEIIEDNIIDTIKESESRYRIVLNHQFDMEVDEGEYYAVRRKPQYPKTYEECAKELGYNQVMPTDHILGYKGTLLSFFQQLLICRDAYWRIAGEQMGLGKSWEPDYNEESYEQGSPIKYVIYYTGTNITKGRKCTPSYILSFPTEEMLEAFYENFKELIDECKELL